jgi:hypothetical protein
MECVGFGLDCISELLRVVQIQLLPININQSIFPVAIVRRKTCCLFVRNVNAERMFALSFFFYSMYLQ